MDEDELGEDIFNAFSWRSGVAGKVHIMKKHFEALSFPECQKNVVEFLESYFVAYCEEDASNKDTSLVVKMKNGDVLQALSEEFFFGCLDDAEFTAVQELRLLELLCGYFEGDKIDPVGFLLFDCLFGNIAGEEIKDILREIKINFLGKLVSMAVTIKCKLVLEFSAILFQKNGWRGKCLTVMSNIINDFCFIAPSAFQILKDIVDISPNFACELTEAAPILYSFNKKRNKDEADDEDFNTQKGLPPIPLIIIIGSWLANQPAYAKAKEPHPFSSLKSIYDFQDQKSKVEKCSIIKLLHWSVLSPLFAGVTVTAPVKGQVFYSSSGSSVMDEAKIRNASSQLHYGILNFFTIHRKVESNVSGDDDDLEPGEVAEQAIQINLINENDIKYVITSLDETVENLKEHITEEKLGECIDRLAQIIQIGKWSGCLAPTSKKFKHTLKKLPKTKLFSKVLKNL